MGSFDVLFLTLNQLNVTSPDTNQTQNRQYAFWVNKTNLFDAMVFDTENMGTSNGIVEGMTSPFSYTRLGGAAQ